MTAPIDRDLERLARLIVRDHIGHRVIREAVACAFDAHARLHALFGLLPSRASLREAALAMLVEAVDSEVERVIAVAWKRLDEELAEQGMAS